MLCTSARTRKLRSSGQSRSTSAAMSWPAATWSSSATPRGIRSSAAPARPSCAASTASCVSSSARKTVQVSDRAMARTRCTRCFNSALSSGCAASSVLRVRISSSRAALRCSAASRCAFCSTGAAAVAAPEARAISSGVKACGLWLSSPSVPTTSSPTRIGSRSIEATRRRAIRSRTTAMRESFATSSMTTGRPLSITYRVRALPARGMCSPTALAPDPARYSATTSSDCPLSSSRAAPA